MQNYEFTANLGHHMTFISNDFIYISKHAYAINSDF